MKLAYLINQYPQPSQSFIRREILAHEAAGWPVERFTIRRFDGKLADPGDEAERGKTSAILGSGKLGLIKALLGQAISNTGNFITALKVAIKNGRTADRGGVLLHIVYLGEACILLPLLRAKGIDHVHAHFGTNSTTVAMLTRVLGGPTYSFTVHGPEEFDRAYGDGLALADKLKHSKFAVTISEFGRGQMMRWTDAVDWPKLTIVHCGIDSTFLDAPLVPQPLNDRVLCVGRIVEQKGQLLLVEAVAELKRRGVNIHLRLIGDGPMRPQIERFLIENKLEDCIELLGSRSAADVRQEMLEARVIAMPSLAEGLPVVLMEALALRRPVITTQIAAIPELVDEKCGWLIPAGAVDRLADALQKALTADANKLTAMGDEGRRRVVERHNADREAERLRNYIREQR